MYKLRFFKREYSKRASLIYYVHPEFGRIEGAPHYYLPTQIFRSWAIPELSFLEIWLSIRFWFSSSIHTYLKKINQMDPFLIPIFHLFRREAIHVPFSRVPVAFCQVWWVNPALPQAHRGQAIQMQSLWTLLCQIWSSRTSHEATFTKGTEGATNCSISPGNHSTVARIALWALLTTVLLQAAGPHYS